jgi:hypothetical protein
MAWFAYRKKHMTEQQHFDLVEKTLDPSGHFAKTLASPLKDFSLFFKAKTP